MFLLGLLGGGCRRVRVGVCDSQEAVLVLRCVGCGLCQGAVFSAVPVWCVALALLVAGVVLLGYCGLGFQVMGYRVC